MNYNPTTRILTIDNYYDLVKFARKQDWEFDCNHPKKIIIDVYDVLDPISPKDVDNLMCPLLDDITILTQCWMLCIMHSARALSET